MNEKTIEILIHLLGYLKDHNFDLENLNEFSENLVINGYSEKDVDEALGILFSKNSFLSVQPLEIAKQQETSVRILNYFERTRINTQVYGYLLKLRSLSIINGVQMEKLIEYCLFLGPQKISETELNEAIANIIFDEYTK